MRETPRRPPDGEWEGTSLGELEGVGMDHGKGAGTTEPASVGPAGDAGPMRPGGTKTPFRPYLVYRARPVDFPGDSTRRGLESTCTAPTGRPPTRRARRPGVVQKPPFDLMLLGQNLRP